MPAKANLAIRALPETLSASSENARVKYILPGILPELSGINFFFLVFLLCYGLFTKIPEIMLVFRSR
jgi:hypothetical protein